MFGIPEMKRFVVGFDSDYQYSLVNAINEYAEKKQFNNCTNIIFNN